MQKYMEIAQILPMLREPYKWAQRWMEIKMNLFVGKYGWSTNWILVSFQRISFQIIFTL